nr:hypothetical protein [Candidatus Njordarchaeota archaeon]
ARYVKTEPIMRFFDELGKARRRSVNEATVKDFIAGSIFARLERLREITGGGVMIRLYGEVLHSAVKRFVDYLYDEVFKKICKENFAEARRFAKELRNACWFLIETRLSDEWKKYKETKAESEKASQ